MNKSLRKIIYWGGGLFTYALMVVAVLCLLFELNLSQSRPTDKNPSAVLGDLGGMSSYFQKLKTSSELSAVLLPVGPKDGQLPGLPEIWTEFSRAVDVDAERVNANGFDGLQAVNNIADFSKGSAAELFLQGKPLRIFLRGKYLLLLNDRGNVQIIDCENRREPVMSGVLPYQRVTHMEMQGDVAYLHLDRPGAEHDKLIVTDLRDPFKPRQITQFNLPEHTMSFFLLRDQLVVYEKSAGYKDGGSIYLYNFTEDSQLAFVGSTKSSLLANGFLKTNEYLLAPDLRTGLHVCDFSNPLQPVVVASLNFPDKVRRFAQSGDVAFVQGKLDRMYVIDLQDPLHPVLSTVSEEANHSASFMAIGDFLYYFTENGNLQVFDNPSFASLNRGGRQTANIAGELVAIQNSGGFALLGESQDLLPTAVVEVLALPDQSNVIDALFWQGDLVVLGGDGLLQLFHKGQKTSLEIVDSLKLPSVQRWVAATKDRLYVGGGSKISVISRSHDDHFVLSGQLELPGEESWDGLVIQETLCVAAGKDGVVFFPVEHPTHLAKNSVWMIPRQLEAQVDVRQLASPGGGRLLAAAGSAGLLSGRIDGDAQFQFDGFIKFLSPIYTLAVVENVCLVSNGTEICVVDIRARDSLQNLGTIAFPGVVKLVAAASDFWAGYVPKVGWSVLPKPQFLSPEELSLLETSRGTALPGALHNLYRLNLFNDQEVIVAAEFMSLPSAFDSQTTGAVNGLQ
jgi:hypothetical protein